MKRFPRPFWALVGGNAVTADKVQDGTLTGADVADGSVGLTKLSGTSGTTTVDPGPGIAAHTCVTVPATAPNVASGDHPIVQPPADLEDGLIVQGLAADTGGVLKVRVCNVSATDPVATAPHTYGFIVLR